MELEAEILLLDETLGEDWVAMEETEVETLVLEGADERVELEGT